MDISEKEKERFFRLISRRFLSLRGAPFVLSSKELDQIEHWLHAGIPLRVVLEGIQSAYENFRKKPVRKRRKLYLAFCHTSVLNAYKQYKDRKIGFGQKVGIEDEKQGIIRKEVKGFLEKTPDDVEYLKPLYEKVVQELSRDNVNEPTLEKYEERVEALLLMNASQEEKNAAEVYASRELKISDTAKLSRVINLKIIKSMREKYKIPYICLYYY